MCVGVRVCVEKDRITMLPLLLSRRIERTFLIYLTMYFESLVMGLFYSRCNTMNNNSDDNTNICQRMRCKDNSPPNLSSVVYDRLKYFKGLFVRCTRIKLLNVVYKN